ncbi:hypothetical protein NP493_892g01016 [Ridgeia piscesae]|uniref:SREBP regulating gene protein n=1 Tax=Ridgeia piscesae TaxID=27915 RepID=A0AAD9KL11_RIDPI|nr:hypothetical protein NP493_892g01016 [Ridgeia piscesae]
MIKLTILRRRWFLGILFTCSFVYFITSIYKQSTELRNNAIAPRPKVRLETFRWQSSYEKSNATKITTCRNSVQGKNLITDDHGYVCERHEVFVNGCCDTQASKRFVCDGCLDNGCCAIYEHCVSCCLQPEKQQLLRKILSRASDTFPNLFASVTDQFELCLTKCRTSSESVQHENSYRNPTAKYCYGSSFPIARDGLT